MSKTISTEDILEKQLKLHHLSEHQGNERTYLAWLRTSISLISFGLAINKFGVYLDQLAAKSGAPAAATSGSVVDAATVGLSLVGFGMLMVVWGAVRYTHVSWMIDRGDYRPNRAVILVITVLVLILGILSLIHLFGR